MRRAIKFLSLSILTCFLLAECKNKKDYDGQEIEFKPLSEFSYTPGSIPAGTTVNLIAYSGGKANEENKIYYYQFIGVDPQANDTFRILSTLISVPSEKRDDIDKIYVPTSEYNPDKRITSAIYYPEDSTNEFAVDMAGVTSTSNDTAATAEKIFSAIKHESKNEKFVVINNSIDIFQRDYKTVFGILHFTEQPW